MIPSFRNIGSLKLADIEGLVTARVTEARTLEFKAAGDYDGDRGLKEWCKDLSALANTEGGCIVLGVKEEDGVAVELTGLDGDIDAMLLRLMQAAEAHIRPRLRVETRRITLPSGRNVVIVATSRSRFGPHMSHAGGDKRFYKRTEVNVEVMDESEVRRAALLSADAEQLAQETHQQRTRRFASNTGRFYIVLDSIIVPEEDRFDPADTQLREQVRNALWESDSHSGEARIVFNGLRVSGSGDDAESRVMRSGAVLMHYCVSRNAGEAIAHQWFPEWLTRAVGALLKVQSTIGIGEPVHLCLTLVGMRERTLTTRFEAATPIDSDVLVFPVLTVEDLAVQPDRLIKPWLDRLWNAAGLERCPLYGADGMPDWHRFKRIL